MTVIGWRCLLLRWKLPLVVGDDLSDHEKRAVESHIARCPGCRLRLDSLRATHRALSACETHDPPDVRPLWPALRSRLRPVEAPVPPERFWLPAAALVAASLAIAAFFWNGTNERGVAERSSPGDEIVAVQPGSHTPAGQSFEPQPRILYDTRPADLSFPSDSYFHLERARPVSYSKGDF